MTKIALIEDNAVISQMYRMKFEADGFEVQLANDGKKGVALVENFAPDMVLMDLQMPEMNGYDATREIKKFHPTVIIIAQTAFAMSDDRAKAIEAGCDDYLAKPIRSKDLTEAVHKYLPL